jgi:DNA polymerase-3 subunit alpha
MTNILTQDTTLRDSITNSDRFKNLDKDTQEATLAEYHLIVAQSLDQYFLDLKGKNLTVKNIINSWVAWVIGITNESPNSIETERLTISEEGSSATPDIDSDFSKWKRHLVKEYIIKKYGQDRVASVGTLSLLKTKVVLKDVARALAYPYEVQDILSKTVDEEFGGGSQGIVKETVKQIIQLVTNDATSYKYPKTKELYEQYVDIFESAVKIEMSPRQCGMHAGAVVITPVPMTDCIPVRMQKSRVKGEEGLITTQLDKNALEELGALKADILGLESLGIMEDTLTLIEQKTGKKIKLTDIPFDDQKTWDTISEGETLGSFQICTPGIRNICKQYKPQSIDDLGAIIAIYRPGPLENGMDKEFITRKWNPSKVSYLKPAHKTEPILKDTKGIIVYQEQCMLISQAVAGYGPAEADVLRKVISKSKKEAMIAERGKFIRGCLTHSHLSDKEANDLFDLIETFGRYGFNKSHSISYAVLGYQMMYLKVNYTLEFITAWFNNKTLEKITTECIPEAKRLGLRIVAPDINRSLVKFTYDEIQKEIIFGLARIKGCGDVASQMILEDRKVGGPYSSIIELFERIPSLSKRPTEAITAAGGFSHMGYKRENILENMEELKALLKRKKAILERQIDHKQKAQKIRQEILAKFKDLEERRLIEEEEEGGAE